MTIRTIFTTTALTLLTGTAAFARESVNLNIGLSHPGANIWVYAMKNAFQPEVDRNFAEND
jgi:C4-dicarboxylate-binding protein DctP